MVGPPLQVHKILLNFKLTNKQNIETSILLKYKNFNGDTIKSRCKFKPLSLGGEFIVDKPETTEDQMVNIIELIYENDTNMDGEIEMYKIDKEDRFEIIDPLSN